MKYFVLLSLSILLFSCKTKIEKKTASYLKFIPRDASIVLKSNNLKKLQSHLKNNSLLQKNTKNPLANYFKNNISFTTLTSTKNDFYLCYSPLGKNDFGYTLVTPKSNSILDTETIKKNSVETFTYNKQNYNKIKLNESTLYTVTLDSTLIVSNNKIILENSIIQHQRGVETSADLKQSLKSLNNNSSASIVINNNSLKDIYGRIFPNSTSSILSSKNWTGWTAGDFSVDANAITFDGVYKPKDSIYDYLSIFNNTAAQKNAVINISPSSAKSLTSYTYNNYNELAKNIALYSHKDPRFKKDAIDDFLVETNEVASLELTNGNVLAFGLINDALDIPAYLATEGSNDNFRDTPIYKLENPIDFSKNLKPIVQAKENQFYCIINSFFICSDSKNSLKELISSVKNKDVLAKKSWFIDFQENLSSQSNVLHISKTEQLLNNLSSIVANNFQKGWKNANLNNYKLAAIQLTNENNFTHIRQVISKTLSTKTKAEVNQTASIILENEINNTPKFLKNHLTKGMDVVVQDKNNILYLISNKGKILWQKEINEPIIGNIQQMDIYKNGRLQLVFVTPTQLYVLDRNGREVKPYPKKFTTPITQPVAIFDYDKNKKYRIAVTQNDQLTLFDNIGKKVNGFKFKNKSKGTITQAPKHIRVGSKDYIIVNESNAGVHFLGRTGNERIKIKGTAPKTNNKWYWHNNAFSTLNEDNVLTQVNTKGTLSTIKIEDANDDTQIDASSKTLVSFTENILHIKNKKVELDFGIYSKPKIFYINNKIYVAITDTQASKVYLFDSNAKPINGFPIYGNSLIDIANSDKDSSLEIIAIGEKNSILFYEM